MGEVVVVTCPAPGCESPTQVSMEDAEPDAVLFNPLCGHTFPVRDLQLRAKQKPGNPDWQPDGTK